MKWFSQQSCFNNMHKYHFLKACNSVFDVIPSWTLLITCLFRSTSNIFCALAVKIKIPSAWDRKKANDENNYYYKINNLVIYLRIKRWRTIELHIIIRKTEWKYLGKRFWMWHSHLYLSHSQSLLVNFIVTSSYFCLIFLI